MKQAIYISGEADRAVAANINTDNLRPHEGELIPHFELLSAETGTTMEIDKQKKCSESRQFTNKN